MYAALSSIDPYWLAADIWRGQKSQNPQYFWSTGGNGGGGGMSDGCGGMGEGPRLKMTVKNFVKNNYSAAPTVLSDFRTIPLGDIDLRREIRLNNDSVIVTSRRLHSAQMHGRSSVMRTVAIYQGDGAEQDWREDVERYLAVRRVPPVPSFLDIYQGSPFTSVYIRECIIIEFDVTQQYIYATFDRVVPSEHCTFFIRRTTGRFCLDFVPSGFALFSQYPQFREESAQQDFTSLAVEQ
ncbi:hypothetical protein C8R45DRAFT_1114247 [Mycena sanguinolenta]|nr:hypothetical protein C8R45DRAFT_1114247 [Mycena sanguinolenta]